MAKIRKSDGTTKEVPDEEVWGKPLTKEEQVVEDRKHLRPMSRTQFAIALASKKILTTQEAVDFAGGNSIPVFAVKEIEGSKLSDLERLSVTIEALSSLDIKRADPIVDFIRLGRGLSDANMDEVFKV